MKKEKSGTGIFQLEDGNYGYRYVITVDGKRKDVKKIKDDFGNPFRTKSQAQRARQIEMVREREAAELGEKKEKKKKIERRTTAQVYKEYCEKGRKGKAVSTMAKQDSLWKEHLSVRFGRKIVSDYKLSDVTDYLDKLYFEEEYSYAYVEGFLKMFYLIFGQAYSRGYLDADTYNKFCVNKDTKIRMPPRKVDDDDEIVVYSKNQMNQLDNYFYESNVETAYVIGKETGVRISECYAVTWDKVDLENGIIKIEKQMIYYHNVLKLVHLKTKNAKREVIMSEFLWDYLRKLRRDVDNWEVMYAESRKQKEIIIPVEGGEPISSLNLVCTLPNGRFQNQTAFKYHAKQIKEKFKFVFHYHYLRHTYATNMALKGLPAHLLCNQMGHSKIDTTNRYYTGTTKEAINMIRDKLNEKI